MLTIILRTIKDRKISLIIYCLAAALFVWMYVAMYPTILNDAEDFQAAFDSYPKEMFEIFGIEDLSFDTLEKFLAMEHYSIIFPLMLFFFLISIAGGALAGEIDKGTIENILAKPISRLKLFFSRYFAGIAALLVFAAANVFSAIPLAHLHNVDYTGKNFLYVYAISLLFGWAIFSIAYMFSAMFSEKSKVYMFSGGLFLLMYVANIASTLIEKLENLQYVSFFYYYDYNKAIIDASIDWLPITVFAGTAIVCTIIGALKYHKRDIAN